MQVKEEKEKSFVAFLRSVFNQDTGNVVKTSLNELWKPAAMYTSALLKGYTDFIVPIMTIESFRNDNSDGNEERQKSSRSIKQNSLSAWQELYEPS